MWNIKRRYRQVLLFYDPSVNDDANDIVTVL